MTTKIVEAPQKIPAWKPLDRVYTKRGEKIYINGNHHPCRQTGTIWYRHDKVVIRWSDGTEQILEGVIQTKERKPRGVAHRIGIRTEVSTVFGNWSVPGSQTDWLLKMNNINTEPDPDESVMLVVRD